MSRTEEKFRRAMQFWWTNEADGYLDEVREQPNRREEAAQREAEALRHDLDMKEMSLLHLEGNEVGMATVRGEIRELKAELNELVAERRSR